MQLWGWSPMYGMKLPDLKLRVSWEAWVLLEDAVKSDLVTRGALVSLARCGLLTPLLSVRRALTLGGGLPHLEHLNLSGCLSVTGAGLQDLVSACPSLNDEHFYYCDNINGNVFLWRCDALLGSEVWFKDTLWNKQTKKTWKPHFFFFFLGCVALSFTG